MSKDTKRFIRMFTGYLIVSVIFILLGYHDEGRIIYLHLAMPFILTPWMFLLAKKLKLFKEDE
ncbi:hypothetical protein BCSAG_49590 [Bacillus cereus]